jgi:hypothetical protein
MLGIYRHSLQSSVFPRMEVSCFMQNSIQESRSFMLRMHTGRKVPFYYEGHDILSDLILDLLHVHSKNQRFHAPYCKALIQGVTGL